MTKLTKYMKRSGLRSTDIIDELLENLAAELEVESISISVHPKGVRGVYLHPSDKTCYFGVAGTLEEALEDAKTDWADGREETC